MNNEMPNAVMEISKQCLSYREETPEIESVSKDAELPKFTPEQFPESFAGRLVWRERREYRPQTVTSAWSETGLDAGEEDYESSRQ